MIGRNALPEIDDAMGHIETFIGDKICTKLQSDFGYHPRANTCIYLLLRKTLAT
jgi:hypothetical protein